MFLNSFKYLYTYFKTFNFNNTALNTHLYITSKYICKIYVVTLLIFYDIHFYMINKFHIIVIL